MSRDWRMHLEDIQGSCDKIMRFVIGMERQDFEADERTYDAVIRNLEIIGESAKHIPDDIQQCIADVDWRKIKGMRDVLAHEYFGIDNDILWDVVEGKIPDLLGKVTKFLSPAD